MSSSLQYYRLSLCCLRSLLGRELPACAQIQPYKCACVCVCAGKGVQIILANATPQRCILRANSVFRKKPTFQPSLERHGHVLPPSQPLLESYLLGCHTWDHCTDQRTAPQAAGACKRRVQDRWAGNSQMTLLFAMQVQGVEPSLVK